MESIQSQESNSIISIDYDDFNNTVEIHIGNESGFRFVNLNLDQCEKLKELIDESKNQIL